MLGFFYVLVSYTGGACSGWCFDEAVDDFILIVYFDVVVSDLVGLVSWWTNLK